MGRRRENRVDQRRLRGRMGLEEEGEEERRVEK